MKKEYEITSIGSKETLKEKLTRHKVDKIFNNFNQKTAIMPEQLVLQHEVYMKWNNDLDKGIKKFFSIFLANLGHVSKFNINRNLKNLKIKGTNNITSITLRLLYHFAAVYNPMTNTMLVSQDMEFALFHELLHMCSTYADIDRVYIGFAQQDIETKEKIGVGLTEGYTSLLCYRYFNEEKARDSYHLERNTTSLLEDLIGKEKMEKMYFSCDLYGLIEELKTYDTEENILKFIRNLDLLYELINVKRKVSDKRITDLIEENNESIKSWLYKKYGKLLEEGKISEMSYFNYCSELNQFLEIMKSRNTYNLSSNLTK